MRITSRRGGENMPCFHILKTDASLVQLQNKGQWSGKTNWKLIINQIPGHSQGTHSHPHCALFEENRVTSQSLWWACLSAINPKTCWEEGRCRENYLLTPRKGTRSIILSLQKHLRQKGRHLHGILSLHWEALFSPVQRSRKQNGDWLIEGCRCFQLPGERVESWGGSGEGPPFIQTTSPRTI